MDGKKGDQKQNMDDKGDQKHFDKRRKQKWKNWKQKTNNKAAPHWKKKKDGGKEIPKLEGTELKTNPKNKGVLDVDQAPKLLIPLVVGCYSIDGNRQYHPDRRNLRYLCLPEKDDGLDFNLNKDSDKTVRKSLEVNCRCEKIDFVLKSILTHRKKLIKEINGKQRLDTDIVCLRGTLALISSTPYEDLEGWIILATRFQGTIYLNVIPTKEEIERRQGESEKCKIMTSWGFKFEQYFTSDKPGGKPNTDEPVNENEDCCLLYQAEFGSHRLVCSGELDALNPDESRANSEELVPEDLVELKTNKILNEHTQNSFDRLKRRKWFLQSFFGGCPKIVTGFKNKSGVIRKYQIMMTEDLQRRPKGWSKKVCLNFCDRFLHEIQEIVQVDDPNHVYRFKFRPHQPLVWDEVQNDQELCFLPQWYTEEVVSSAAC